MKKSDSRMKFKALVLNLATIFASCFIAVVISEIAFQTLLFSDLDFMKNFRDPSLYSDENASDEFWKLRVLFGGLPAQRNDPLLGYVDSDIEPETYRHSKAGEIGPRIPVLLYGDSFADCSCPPEDCFEGLFNSNEEFSSRYFLINYGVGGYGLDQIYLLYKKTIDSYTNPIVIFSFLDGDMDRCVLTMREGQKPFFKLNNNQLELHGLPIETDQNKFFSKKPPDTKCYLCSMLNFSSLFRWLSDANSPFSPQRSVKEAISQALLLTVSEDLKTRKLRHVFLVFEGLHRTWQRPLNWRIKFLSNLFAQNNIPHLWARQAIEANTNEKEFNSKEFLFSSKDAHPNRFSNSIIAGRIMQWIKTGRSD